MFIERLRPAGHAKNNRRVHKVGINDAPYVTGYKDENGESQRCPYYVVWAGVLERCFSETFHARRPTYKGCTLEESWKTFSNFKTWMMGQNWQGRCIDKDLISWDNKHYGPETCVFIPASLNNLLTLCPNHRGDLPLGVSKATINNQEYFIASCSFYGKQKRLGYFKTPEEAAEKYREAKLGYIHELAMAEKDPRIRQALLNLY